MKGQIRRLSNRGPDVWQARWYVGTDDRGRKVERTRTFHARTARDADDEGARILAELRSAAEADAERVGTVGWYAAVWLKRKRADLSPTTIDRSYAPIIDRIVSEFGTMRLDEVRPTHVKTWYAKLATTKSGTGKRRHTLTARTIERHHQVLRAMFREALEDELVDRVPTTVRRGRIPKSRTTMPTTAAVRVVLDAVRGDFGHIVRLEAETGLRNGEIAGLLWSDIEPYEVDGTKGLLINVRRAVIEPRGGGWKVKTTKTDAERRVVVLDDGVAALEAQLTSVTEQMGGDRLRALGGFVFPDVRVDRTGRTPRRPSWITRRWESVRDEHGLTGVRFYDLRHFHASHLAASGVDPKALQARMGHASITTTMDVYAKVMSVNELEAARASRVRA